MSDKIHTTVPPCSECGGKCCDYVAIEIGKPTTKADYDHIRWYLAHKNIHVFVDHEKKWFIEFRTPCEMMDNGKLCTIYQKRPKICRDHGNTEGECEYYDNPYNMYFTTLYEFERYLDKKGIQWKFKRY